MKIKTEKKKHRIFVKDFIMMVIMEYKKEELFGILVL